MFKKKPVLIAALACLCCLLFAAYAFFIQKDANMVDENGMMEIYQALFLLMAGISFAVQSLKTSAMNRVLTIFLSLLSLSMMHREVETAGLNVPDFVHTFFLSSNRYILIVPTLLLLVYLFYKIPYFWRNRSHILSKPTTLILFIGILCYLVLNEFFENGLFTGIYDIFFEEGVEMIGATLFFIASFFIVEDYRWMGVEDETPRNLS
ncbi:MAG: hypothetical protein CR955_00635 [Thiotrichales bacterium]|nr:MAG: hypothetical protein CR955_00635 [Thiotrichales bacterium]